MPHTLIVMAEGHGRYLLDFDPHPEKPGMIDLGDVVLPPPHSIAGRVLDIRGRPVENVPVTLDGHNADRTRLRGEQIFNPFGRSERRYTDDVGRFHFPDLSPGVYRVSVSPSGVEPVSQEVVLEEGKDRLDIEIALGKVREFRVTVTDRGGIPLAGVRVAVQTEAGAVSGQTDTKGEARTTVRSRVTNVYAYPPSGGRVFFFKQQAVSGDPDQIHLVLDEGQVITGKVLAPEGGPLAGAVIQVKRAGKDVAGAVADTHGRFKATVPVGSGTIDLVLIGVRRKDRTTEIHAFEAEVKGILPGSGEIVLQATSVPMDSSLRVKIVYPDGSPVVGARLFVRGFALITTDEKGEGVFRGLPAKEIILRVLPPDELEGFVAPLPRKIVPDAEAELVIALRPAAKITGEVVRQDGSPAAKAMVQLGREGVTWTAVTDEQGHFAISVPADDQATWTLTATLRVGRMQLQGTREGIHAGDGDVRIELEEDG